MNFDKVPEYQRDTRAVRARIVRRIVFSALIILALGAGVVHRLARRAEAREERRVAVAVLQERRVAAEEAVAVAKKNNAPLEERITLMERLLHVLRELAEESGRGLNVYVEDIQRTEAELDWLYATQKVQLSLDRERDAITAANAGDNEAALEAWREAWQLQRDINRRGAALRNLEREQRLEQEVTRLIAEPLQQELQEKLARAEAAVAQQQWDAALSFYREARGLRERLNHEFPRSRYSDVAALARIDAEIAALSADGLDATINAKLSEARQLAESGRREEAVQGLEEAAAAQRVLNERFSRSRFVSNQRVDEIEVERQTALAVEPLQEVARLRAQVERHLRRREVFQAQQAAREALEKLDDISARLPKAKGVDEEMRQQLAFLNVRADDVATLQDRFYDQLAPLPGHGSTALLRSEVVQAEFSRLMSSNPSRNPGRMQPTDSVTWNEAIEFCRRATWVLGWPVRLPTLEEMRTAANTSDFQNVVGGLNEWLATGAEGASAPFIAAEGKVEQAPRTERSRQRGFRVVVEVDLASPLAGS